MAPLQENLWPHYGFVTPFTNANHLRGEKWLDSFVNRIFRRGVNEGFVLLGCYATLIVTDVSVQPTGRTFKDQAAVH